jgi:phenylacetate-CoA ligase
MYVPQPLRSVCNRIRGRIAWTYMMARGEVDAPYMASLHSGERLGLDQLRELQWKKLKTLLAHAYDTVPYYCQQMNKLGAHPMDICTLEDFRKLPILTKKELREGQKDLISNKYTLATLHASQTGGSTGEPVKVYMDRHRIRFATTDEIWADGFSGWKIGEPVARLWGASELKHSVSRFRQLFRRYVLRPGFKVEAYDLNRRTFLSFIDNYNSWHPTLVIGYASALRALSQFLLSEGSEIFPPKAVISTAELLDDHTRLLIGEAFGCPVTDRYGSREIGLIACQCAEGKRYHVNMHRVYLEIISDNGAAASPHEVGRVVVTDLGNYGMPLIRYEIGDRAQGVTWEQCVCGRQYESLARLEGRSFDFLITSSGKKIHGLSFNRYIFRIPGISQYRLVQESRDLVRIQVIENKTISDENVQALTALIREKMGGNVIVKFERVDHLPKTPSGKLRYVECRVG